MKLADPSGDPNEVDEVGGPCRCLCAAWFCASAVTASRAQAGNTALQIAAYAGHEGVVELLLADARVDVGGKDPVCDWGMLGMLQGSSPTHFYPPTPRLARQPCPMPRVTGTRRLQP